MKSVSSYYLVKTVVIQLKILEEITASEFDETITAEIIIMKMKEKQLNTCYVTAQNQNSFLDNRYFDNLTDLTDVSLKTF